MDAVEEVVRRYEQENPPPPPGSGNTSQQPAATGIAMFGKSSHAPPATEAYIHKSPADKAKELVKKYIEWCDSPAAPTTAMSWGEVLMKWPTEWTKLFPEVAQAFR